MNGKRLLSRAGDTGSRTSSANARPGRFGVESNRDANGVRWFHVTGELDAATADQFRDALMAAVGDRWAVIDASAVTFIDSAGLGVVVGAVRRIQEAGGHAAIVAPPRGVGAALRVAALDRITPIVDSPAAASDLMATRSAAFDDVDHRQYEGPAVIAVDGCERPVVAHLRKWRQHDDGWAWVGAATTRDDLCGLFQDRGLHLRICMPDGQSGEADVGEFDADRVSFLGTGAPPF